MFPTLTSRFGNLFSEMDAVTREVDRLFERSAGNGQAAATASVPVSLWEGEDEVHMELDVPGFAQEDIELTVKDGRLWIRGQRKTPQYQGKCWYDERRYGRFERVISLSDLIDPQSVQAELVGGVLHVTLTKRPEAKPQRIAINVRHDEPKRLEGESAATE